MQQLDFEISDYKEYGDGSCTFFRNVSTFLPNYTSWDPRGHYFSLYFFHPNFKGTRGRIILNGVLKKADGKSLNGINLLKPTGHVMHQEFNIQQLYVLPTLYLCVLYLSEDKQRLVPLTA